MAPPNVGDPVVVRGMTVTGRASGDSLGSLFAARYSSSLNRPAINTATVPQDGEQDDNGHHDRADVDVAVLVRDTLVVHFLRRVMMAGRDVGRRFSGLHAATPP